jgi:hypothetical protein
LKFGTLKVNLSGYKLGERFLKIVFENSIKQRVHEIYVTIFPRSIEQQRLEAVMNSITNSLGMRNTAIAKKPSRPCNPHFYAVFAQVHNTL